MKRTIKIPPDFNVGLIYNETPNNHDLCICKDFYASNKIATTFGGGGGGEVAVFM